MQASFLANASPSTSLVLREIVEHNSDIKSDFSVMLKIWTFHLSLKLVIELLKSLLAQKFLAQRNFSSMFSMLQPLPVTLQVMYELPILRCKCWLVQRLQLGVDVEIQCLNLTALFVPATQQLNQLKKPNPTSLKDCNIYACLPSAHVNRKFTMKFVVQHGWCNVHATITTVENVGITMYFLSVHSSADCAHTLAISVLPPWQDRTISIFSILQCAQSSMKHISILCTHFGGFSTVRYCLKRSSSFWIPSRELGKLWSSSSNTLILIHSSRSLVRHS